MSYEEELKCNPTEKRTFQEIRKLSIIRCQQISSEERGSLYKSLERGQKILESEKQVDEYMVAYGMKHYLKFTTLFESLPPEIFNNVFDVLDWGCGPGLGLVALADFCRTTLDRPFESKVRQITLIEPSSVSLERAAICCKWLFPESTLIRINKSFQDLDDNDFQGGGATVPRIHILSNVLDIELFDDERKLIEFANKVKLSAFSLDEIFICVSPSYNNITHKFEKFITAIADPVRFEISIIVPPHRKSVYKR